MKRFVFALLLTWGNAGCASDEKVAAEQALATWRNTRPTQYTYVLEPRGGSNPGEPVRLKVVNEEVLEALEASGAEPEYRRLSMTALLERAIAAADQDTFSGSYDAELGFVRSFFYAPGPDEEPGGYGFDVPCLEPTLDEDACSDVFRMKESPR